MLNRKFTKGETALILVLVALLLGLLYYRFVYTWIEDSLTQYDTTELEDQLMIDQARAMQMRQMQDEIDADKSEQIGVVETYNNQKAEIVELNDIFADANTFNFSFDQAVANGNTVRRNFSGTYTADSYAQAKAMLTDLYHCRYRCLIRDISIAPNNRENSDDNSLASGGVTVSFTATFYETLYGASTTSGLVIENADTSNGESLTDELSERRDTVENMGN